MLSVDKTWDICTVSYTIWLSPITSCSFACNLFRPPVPGRNYFPKGGFFDHDMGKQIKQIKQNKIGEFGKQIKQNKMSQKWAPTIPKDAARLGDLGKRISGPKC